MKWFEAVEFCRWLGKQAELTEDEQCYEDPLSLPKDVEGNPNDWHVNLDQPGYRLLTEAEWELACRGGPARRIRSGKTQTCSRGTAGSKKTRGNGPVRGAAASQSPGVVPIFMETCLSGATTGTCPPSAMAPTRQALPLAPRQARTAWAGEVAGTVSAENGRFAEPPLD